MLNRSKLFQEVEKFSGTIFYDYSQELQLANDIWTEIIKDNEFAEKIKKIQIPWILPSWQEKINNSYSIKNTSKKYSVISVDGSQIYPDRHQGTSCFLINIGSVFINYGSTNEDNKNLKFDSVPFLFSAEDSESVDIVDCKRQELEFQFGLENLLANQSEKNPTVFLFDGSLIFWHLESRGKGILEEYLGKYLGLLHQYYKNNLLIAGFISLPKSKELVNLIRVKLNESLIDNIKSQNVDHILDTHIANFFLKPFEKTILFKNHSPITQNYPEYLKPHFFYLNLGSEIVRIELPEYIAKDQKKIDLISQIIVDQCVKGYGYPICLAEAHEQAVVKGYDRDFFYQLLNTLGVRHKQQILISQKSAKKRVMGI